jgi:hypothetical protein
MNKIQRKNGGIEAALAGRCYKIINHTIRVFVASQTIIKPRLTKTNCCYDVYNDLLVQIPPSFMKSKIGVPVLECQETGSLQANPSKNIFSKKGKPAYSYLQI